MRVMANETTAERWTARVAGWRASGLTAREYCVGRDFNAGGLHNWASVLKRRAATSTTATAGAPMRWVALRAQRADHAPAPPISSGAASEPSRSAPLTLTVEFCAARVAIPSGFDAPTLRLVLETLARVLPEGGR